jgi:uncharacterized phiE125 gp8 family phage protein
MPHWTDIVTTAPAAEPVCVEEIKTFLRIDHNEDDTMIAAFIKTARIWVENYCGRALITQTRQLKADDFPACAVIDQFRAPLASVTSVVYIDAENVSQTLSSSLYQVDTTSTPPRLGLEPDESWPTTRLNTFNAVIITYVAGSAAADVPVAIKEAIKRIVRGLYEGCSMDDAADSGAIALLADYRTYWPS